MLSFRGENSTNSANFTRPMNHACVDDSAKDVLPERRSLLRTFSLQIFCSCTRVKWLNYDVTSRDWATEAELYENLKRRLPNFSDHSAQ